MARQACSSVANRCICTQALFKQPYKLSIVELSQQSPLQLMDERTPQSAKAVWKPVLQHRSNLSLCKIAPGSGHVGSVSVGRAHSTT